MAVAGGAAARTLAGVTSGPAAATADDALSTSRLDHVGFCIAILLVNPVSVPFRKICLTTTSSAERAAAFRRHVEPDRCSLRDVLGRRGDHTNLRAVRRLDHVVPTRAQKHLPRHRAR